MGLQIDSAGEASEVMSDPQIADISAKVRAEQASQKSSFIEVDGDTKGKFGGPDTVDAVISDENDDDTDAYRRQRIRDALDKQIAVEEEPSSSASTIKNDNNELQMNSLQDKEQPALHPSRFGIGYLQRLRMDAQHLFPSLFPAEHVKVYETESDYNWAARKALEGDFDQEEVASWIEQMKKAHKKSDHGTPVCAVVEIEAGMGFEESRMSWTGCRIGMCKCTGWKQYCHSEHKIGKCLTLHATAYLALLVSLFLMLAFAVLIIRHVVTVDILAGVSNSQNQSNRLEKIPRSHAEMIDAVGPVTASFVERSPSRKNKANQSSSLRSPLT